jgi:hypothetical protein
LYLWRVRDLSLFAARRLQFKPLINDNVWSLGSNFLVTIPAASAATTAYPYFFTDQGMYGLVKNIWSPQVLA